MTNSYQSRPLSRPGAITLLLVCATLWSLGGILIKWIDWHPVAIAGMRSAISAVVMVIFLRRPRFNWTPAQIGAAVAYATTVTLFVAANKMTTAANAILLQYTAPIFVAIFGAWFLKERTTWLDSGIIASVMVGMLLFFCDDLAGGKLTGNLVAVASGLALAVMVVLLRKQKDGAPVESLLLGNALTALIGLPFMFRSMPSATSWAGLAIAGVFQLGLPYIMYAIAIRRVTAVEAIVIPVIEPILNPLWVFLLMGEAPGLYAIIGGAVVLLSVTARSVLGAIRPTGNKAIPADVIPPG